MQLITNPHANPQVENLLTSHEVHFTLEEIRVDEIRNVRNFQVREVADPIGAYEGEFSKQIVDEYLESLKRGDKFPAIVVRQTDYGYDMVDGRHRFYANKSNGAETIWAYVVPGHLSDQACRAFACLFNDIHGYANSSDVERKKVSIENAVSECLRAQLISNRDPLKLVPEFAKLYGVSDATLRTKVRAKLAKQRILSAGESSETIPDSTASHMHPLVEQASNETILKLKQTIEKAREHGISTDRINITIREANQRNKTTDQVIKELQVQSDLDEHNRKLRSGEADVLRRTECLIANLESAKQSLNKQVSSYRLSPEKIKQIRLCLEEIKTLAAAWTKRLCE